MRSECKYKRTAVWGLVCAVHAVPVTVTEGCSRQASRVVTLQDRGVHGWGGTAQEDEGTHTYTHTHTPHSHPHLHTNATTPTHHTHTHTYCSRLARRSPRSRCGHHSSRWPIYSNVCKPSRRVRALGRGKRRTSRVCVFFFFGGGGLKVFLFWV